MSERKPSQKLFDRIGDGHSYIPANAEGWGCLWMFGLTALAAIGAGDLASDWLDSILPSVVGWIAAAAIFIALIRFARRRS